jgi:hypothetical protein
MNGELAQLVALTAHGNAALQDPGTATELVDASSTFRFVNSVQFISSHGDSAEDCQSWWSGLRQRGVRRLFLNRVRPRPTTLAGFFEHHQAAFAGGLAIGILAHAETGDSEWWTGRWEVTQPKHPRQLIWKVIYQGERARGARAPAPSREPALAELRHSLERIRDFALSENAEFWVPWFADALKLLASPEPTLSAYPDLLPASGYSLGSRQLLSAIARGWVFGGMGSWNDIGTSNQATYDEVTRAYFDAVMNAAVAAVNAFEPGPS